jgi:hypothetical protein
MHCQAVFENVPLLSGSRLLFVVEQADRLGSRKRHEFSARKARVNKRLRESISDQRGGRPILGSQLS